MRRFLRAVLFGLAGLVALALLAVGALYARGTWKLRAAPELAPEPALAIPTDSASIARGARLVGMLSCGSCHGDDLGGKVFAEIGLLGRLAGPNLTRGRGGLDPARTDAEWERAIRHGVRRGGRTLVVMPSEGFNAIADDDLAAMIAYLRQAPPVDREAPPTEIRIGARVLLGLGEFKTAAELVSATPHVATVDTTPGVEYGRYLVAMASCRTCHGEALSGGPGAGPDDPPASNLTLSGIGHYTEEDFIRTLRTGRRPAGTPLSEAMPWKYFGTMSDGALRSIWLYLRTLPPKGFNEQ